MGQLKIIDLPVRHAPSRFLRSSDFALLNVTQSELMRVQTTEIRLHHNQKEKQRTHVYKIIIIIMAQHTHTHTAGY